MHVPKLIIMKLILLVCIILTSATVSFGQQNYLAGFAKVSIEPDSSIFSSALAGYGLPRAGRFSLSWKKNDQQQQLIAIAGLEGKLIAVNVKNEVLSGISEGNSVKWTRIGKIEEVSSLASLNGKLYAITKKNGLIEGSIKGSKISWKTLACPKPLTAVTGFNGNLYATANDHQLMVSSNIDEKTSWRNLGSIESIISLTADDRQLYAINDRDTLWSFKPGLNSFSRQQLGRNNSFNYNIHVKSLAVVNSRLYAVSNEGELYYGAQTTMNNLSARAVAIKRTGKTIVLVGVDVCGMNYSLSQDIKAAVLKSKGIPASAILINASHTHFAPVTQAWTTWGEFYHVPDSAYLNHIVKKRIIQVIEQAVDAMSVSVIYVGRGDTHIGYNRRENQNPEKPYDTTLDVIKILDVEKETSTVLFSAGCHPVFENENLESFTINANYPAISRARIEGKLDVKQSIFLQGCAGDINPASESYVETGTELAHDVIKVLKAPMQKLDGDITFFLDSISIPVKPMSLKEVQEFKVKNTVPPGNVFAEKNVRWADLMLDRYAKGTVKNTLPEYVQTINLGKWKYVGLSREAVTEYGPAIRKIWPDRVVTVSGYCNDVPSYLPIGWHIKTGVYEGNESFFWYGQPGIPPMNVLEIITDKIKSLNR
jgi:hypothetical protein